MAHDAIVEFRLYIAGNLPNSQRAIKNLYAFCETNLQERYSIEVLDVFDAPKRALADHIMLTPQLVVISGGRAQYLVGDLADASAIRKATLNITDM